LIAKAAGHHHYEILRKLKAVAEHRAKQADLANEQERLQLTQHERHQRDQAFHESRAIYDAAWAKANKSA
jgi:hypothetical protein